MYHVRGRHFATLLVVALESAQALKGFLRKKPAKHRLGLPMMLGEKTPFMPSQTSGFDDIWEQIGSDILFNGSENTVDDDYIYYFGWSLATSKDSKTIAIGTPFTMNYINDEFYRGVVQVFKSNDDEDWEKKGVDLRGNSNFDWFGYSLAMSADGDTLAVSSPGYDNSTGCVQVFEYEYESPSVWEDISDKFYGDYDYDLFGFSIALSENAKTLVVGAPGNLGKVQTFERRTNKMMIEGRWDLVSTIMGESKNDLFGYSVGLSAHACTLVIGSPWYNKSTGLVQIYKDGSLIESIDGSDDYDYFGWSISLSGDGKALAIASPGYDNATGLVEVYKEGRLTGSTTGRENQHSEQQYFGAQLKISDDGSSIAVSSTKSVTVFKHRILSCLDPVGNELESEMEILGATTPVAFSDDGNTIMLGYIEENNSTGVVRMYERRDSGSFPFGWNTHNRGDTSYATVFIKKIQDILILKQIQEVLQRF